MAPYVSLTSQRGLSVLLPPIYEQRAIAEILSTIDEKIQVNRRMNETLEAMMLAHFRSWFIDFDPVGAEAASRNAGVPSELAVHFGERLVPNAVLGCHMPQGWRSTTLGEELDLMKDGSHNPPKRVPTGVKFIAGATEIQHFSIDFRKCTFITEHEYSRIHKKWSVQAGDVLLTIVGTVGNVAIVSSRDLPFSLQRSVAVLRPGPLLSTPFLYCLLISRPFKAALDSLVNPTGQPGVYLGALSKIRICVPPRPLVERFDSVAGPYIERMQGNLLEARTLASLFSTLLPKLMSGVNRRATAESVCEVTTP
jgi:type I restriction enzyme S subunit